MNYKKILSGVTLFLVMIFVGIFTWLWIGNNKNIDPLPIMANVDSETYIDANDNDDDTKIPITEQTVSILKIQALDTLQVPLDDIIVRFEARYPSVQILANYVSTQDLLSLDVNNEANDLPSQDTPFVVNKDMIITDNKLTQEQLAPVQSLLDKAQTKLNQNRTDPTNQDDNDEVAQTDSLQSGNQQSDSQQNNSQQTRTLSSFSYALKEAQPMDGIILTKNPAAVSFRNYLLSSVGQDILKQYNYDNIDGYKNSMDDLFNPMSQAKTASDDDTVKVADALAVE